MQLRIIYYVVFEMFLQIIMKSSFYGSWFAFNVRRCVKWCYGSGRVLSGFGSGFLSRLGPVRILTHKTNFLTRNFIYEIKVNEHGFLSIHETFLLKNGKNMSIY
jgi:hypothetical protein